MTPKLSGEQVAAYLAGTGVHHHGQLGIEYIAHGDNWAEVALPYGEHLVGVSETGIMASGPVVTLVDVASGIALLVRLGASRPNCTLDLRVDYLRPAVPGKTVHARAECYKLTRQIGFVRGHAHDGDAGDPVANFSGTFMLLDGDDA